MQRNNLIWLPLLTLLSCTHPSRYTSGGAGAGGASPAAGGAGAAASSGQSGAGAAAGSGASAAMAAGGAAGAGISGASSFGGVAMGGSGGLPNGGEQGCPRACGPTFEQFFDEKKLATLRIELRAEDLPGFTRETWLDALWEKWTHCPPFKYFPARMTYTSPDGAGDITLENVGMRLRGSRARGFAETQGFKLDVQALDTPGPEGKRRFADLNRVNILSIEGDESHMVQCLAYKALRSFGVPAPRCNLIKVYVNDEYYGLLENAEQINKGFLRRHFGNSEGSLYGASPSMSDCPTGGFKDSQARLGYDGDTFESYSGQYQLTHATAAEAEQNLIPMLKCGDASQTPDDAAFKTCIAEWLDVEEWLRLIAAESVLPELESFVGFYRNYYLYFKPDAAAPHGGRFVVWPWDLDSAFGRGRCVPSDCDVLTSVSSLYRTERAKLVTRLTKVFRSEYCTALNGFLETVYKPSLVSELALVAEPGLVNEPSVSTTMWQRAVSDLQAHITTRTTSAQTSIAKACR